MNLPSDKLQQAVDQLASLPGVGKRSALRFALHLMKLDQERFADFVSAISAIKTEVHACRRCHCISDTELCPICSSPKRQHGVVCVVENIPDGPTQVYIDRLYCHEVTSPQAFDGLRSRGIRCFRPGRIFCMPDHNIPTRRQESPIQDLVSRKQVDALTANAAEFGLTLDAVWDGYDFGKAVTDTAQNVEDVITALGEAADDRFKTE